MRPDAVRMIFIERKQVPPVLQDNSGLRLDDAGAEAHEVALDERYEIAFTVRRGNVFGIGTPCPLFHSPPSRGRRRGGRPRWQRLKFVGGSVHSDLRE